MDLKNLNNKLFERMLQTVRLKRHETVPRVPISLHETLGSLEVGPVCSDGDAVYSSSKFKKSIGPLVMYAISDVDALPWRRERALCSYNDVIYTCRPLFLISPAYVTNRRRPAHPPLREALFSIPFLNYCRKTSTLRNNSY